MRRESTPLAILFSLSAGFVYALLAFLIQLTEKHLPTPTIIFFRQLIGLFLFLPMISVKFHRGFNLKTKCFSLYLLRAFSTLSAMFCLYFALRYLPLTDAVLLSYARPLFIPIIVYFWFHKKWTRSTWYGLAMGFIGVVVILKPDEKIFDIAALVGIASAMFGAISFTTLRRLTKTEPSDRILFYYLVLSVPLASIPLLTSWHTPTLYEWGLLLLIGIGGVTLQMLLTRAYRHAKAFKIGSLLYSSVVFAWIFDKILGGGEISLLPFLGIVLIIIGSIIALREQKTQV